MRIDKLISSKLSSANPCLLKEFSHQTVTTLLALSSIAIIVLTIVAISTPLHMVIKAWHVASYKSGSIDALLESDPVKLVSVIACVFVPAIFAWCDLKLARLDDPDWRKNEFLSYAILADGPATCTMAYLAVLYFSTFHPISDIGDSFYAGASAFQFIGFNVAFTIVGMVNVDIDSGSIAATSGA